MYLEIFDITPLRNFFDIIYDSANIVEMKLDTSKLSISLLNNSHIAFYNLEMSKEFFGDYVIDGAEEILIFVDDFYKILKSATKDDVLFLETTDNHLVCKFEHDNNRRVFELPLAEDYGESAVPPSIDYKGVFDLLLNDLKQPCNDLDKIIGTDRFKMITQDQVLTIVAPTDSMTAYNQMIDIDSDALCNVVVNLEYVKQLLKLSKINKVVTLKMGDGIPLSWSINSPDELVCINGLIAPIIENEEE